MASALGKAPPETERKERRGRLQGLRLRIGDMKNALYCEAELNRLHVHIEPFTLNEEEEPAFKPCFFKPFMGQLKDDPRALDIDDDDWLPYYDDPSEKLPKDWARLTFHYWCEYSFDQILDFEKRLGFEVPGFLCKSYASPSWFN